MESKLDSRKDQESLVAFPRPNDSVPGPTCCQHSACRRCRILALSLGRTISTHRTSTLAAGEPTTAPPSNSGGSVAKKHRLIPMFSCEARDPAWWMRCLRSDQMPRPRSTTPPLITPLSGRSVTRLPGWSDQHPPLAPGMPGLPAVCRKVPSLTRRGAAHMRRLARQ